MCEEAAAVTRFCRFCVATSTFPVPCSRRDGWWDYNILSLGECEVDEVRGRPVCVCVWGGTQEGR